MSDVAIPEIREIANPATGELLSKDDPAGCAVALDEIRELEWRLKEVKRWLTDALLEEVERQGTKTLHLPGGVTAVLKTGDETQWDVTELVKLLDLGLPPERYAALVTEEITYKVNAAVAKQIEAANPDYAKVVEQARRKIPKTPSATIKR